MHYRKRAQCIADKYEKASHAKRTLKQVQTVLDRLDEELSGERVVLSRKLFENVNSLFANESDGYKTTSAPSAFRFFLRKKRWDRARVHSRVK